MENLLIPTTGIRSRFFRFLKKAFQRSLICLVIFCFSFAPLPNTINLFAQEAVIDQGSNQALLPLPDDHVDSQINPNDMGLVGPESEVSTDISNLPTLDKSSPDQNTPEVSNPEETPEDIPENPDEIINQEQSLEASSSAGSNEYPEGKIDGIQASKPKTDLLTGAMVYNYPIGIPPGRVGMTPELELGYNSQENDNGSAFGYAWGVNIPYIERVNKNGSEKLYTEKNFTSSLDGELVEVAPNTYAPRVDNGAFHKYEFVNNHWEFTDKSGITYKFGTNTNARQDNPTTTSQVYKWMLDEKRDSNGNYISYEYYKDAGQIYPYKIKYTQHALQGGIFEVEFLRQGRPDEYTSYKTTFEVTTKYRIYEIQAKINGTWVRKYELGYTVGDNGYRSLVEFIKYSAKDKNSVVTTLPQTKFTYQKTTPGWTLDKTWKLPVTTGDGYQHTFDVKGDSWVDILQSVDRYGQGLTTGPHRYEKLLYNHSTNKNWIADQNFNIPTFFLNYEVRGGAYGRVWDQGVRTADINGDYLTDIVQAMVGNPNNTKKPVIFASYLYDRSNGFVKSNDWLAKIPFTGSDEIHDFGTHLVDINGDGLPDVIRKQGSNIGEQLNTGSGFANITTNWTPPTDQLTFTINRIVDINADGLPDAMQSNYMLSHSAQAYLNKGNTGWTGNNSNWETPIAFAYNHYDQGVRFIDVNSDNLIDIVIDPANQTGGNRGTYLNTGNGWVYRPVWDMVTPPGSLMGSPVIIADINADGFVDFMRTINYMIPETEAYINNGNKIPDLLSKIEYGSGGSSEIVYKKSAQYKNSLGNLLNPVLPMNLNTVENIINNDGLNNIAKTSYEYADGDYYYNGPFDRKFAGFGKVTQINPNTSREVTYYSQANSTDTNNGEYDDSYAKIGKIYRTDFFDVNNNLLKQSTNKWTSAQVAGGNNYFVYVEQVINRIFSGSNSYDTAETYNYDVNTGNLIEKIEHGNVVASGYQSFNDIGNDTRQTSYKYTGCASTVCLNLQLPSQIILRDSGGTKVYEKNLYYDNLGFGLASMGNNTSQSIWVSGSNYQTTSSTYNNFGLVTSMTDAKNNTTNITYDPQNLYPNTITNALSKITNYTYDYNTGKVIKSTNSNGMINEVDCDGFGRLLAERSSSDTSFTNLITKVTFNYNDIMSGGVLPYVQKNTHYSNTLMGTAYSLMDGFGREVRQVTNSGGAYIANDTMYDNMGQVYKKSLPYSLTGVPTNYSLPINDPSIITTIFYDALGRTVSISNTLGTTINNYYLNKTTNIDPENHLKDVVRNAYGNIVNVVEHNAGNTYTTVYSWDVLGNLTGMTDALDNIRSFTYDAVGNKLSATDLHEISDTNYGAYSYIYDANNNLVRKTTPNGDVITYTYDALNRITHEFNNSAPQIAYTYDSCTHGIGMLCSVNRFGSAKKDFTYTNRGLVATDAITLGTKIWGSSYLYDFAGNAVQIKYPDSSSVRYGLNNLGQVVGVEARQNPASLWAGIINNVIYNNLGQKESVFYANGRVQNYTYDTARQYQLIKNSLDAPATYSYPKFIETNYKWSPTGNLTEKVESFDPTNPQKFTYTYDDLSRLIGVIKTVNSPLTGYTESFNYNAIGNILSKSGIGTYAYNGTVPGNYANPNAGTNIGGIDYDYDKNGNVVGFGTSPNNTVLTYNYRNELVKYERTAPPNPVTNTFLYDHAGMRIKVVDSGGTTYTSSKYFEESGTIKKKHIYLGSQLIATIESPNPLTQSIYYVHPDYLGGTQLITDGAGLLKVEEIEYYPFGQILLDTKFGGFDQSHKYTGHEYDIDTDLNYMQARYQAGYEGRFFSQDPIVRELDNSKLEALLIDPQRWNTYAYANNNPLKYVDPDGQSAVSNIIQNIKNGWASLFNGEISKSNAHVIVPVSQQITKTEPVKTTTWDPVTDRRISNLDPRVQQPATNFINNTESQLGIQLRVTDGYRTIEEQAKIYASGRTESGPILTKSKPGLSYHNYGRAIDVTVVENGRVYAKPISQDIVKIGEGQGFFWGGVWSPPDRPHFQMSLGETEMQLYQKYLKNR